MKPDNNQSAHEERTAADLSNVLERIRLAVLRFTPDETRSFIDSPLAIIADTTERLAALPAAIRRAAFLAQR